MQWRRVDVGIDAVTPDANLLEAQNVCFGEMDLNTGSRVRWLKILHCPGRYLFCLGLWQDRYATEYV